MIRPQLVLPVSLSASVMEMNSLQNSLFDPSCMNSGPVGMVTELQAAGRNPKGN